MVSAEVSRYYYNELVEKASDETIILTLTFGKFRLFGIDLVTLSDLPRLLDME